MSHRLVLTLAGALLAAACSHAPPPTQQARVQTAVEEARGELRALIADPDRATRADALVVKLDGLFKQAATEADAVRAQVDALDRRHDATADQLQAVLAAGDAARLQRIHELVAVREQLARLLTAEEWKKSAAVRRKLLELQLGPQPL